MDSSSSHASCLLLRCLGCWDCVPRQLNPAGFVCLTTDRLACQRRQVAAGSCIRKPLKGTPVAATLELPPTEIRPLKLPRPLPPKVSSETCRTNPLQGNQQGSRANGPSRRHCHFEQHTREPETQARSILACPVNMPRQGARDTRVPRVRTDESLLQGECPEYEYMQGHKVGRRCCSVEPTCQKRANTPWGFEREMQSTVRPQKEALQKTPPTCWRSRKKLCPGHECVAKALSKTPC